MLCVAVNGVTIKELPSTTEGLSLLWRCSLHKKRVTVIKVVRNTIPPMTLPAIIPVRSFFADDAGPLVLLGLTLDVGGNSGGNDVPPLEVGITLEFSDGCSCSDVPTLEAEIILELDDDCPSTSCIAPSNTVKAEVCSILLNKVLDDPVQG